MNHAIVINGPSAVGKTTVTRMLLPKLASELKLGVIHGDFLSNLVYPFVRSNEQLDLKYRNMASLIQNLAEEGYTIVINDIFRRDHDIGAMVELLKTLNHQVLVIRLTATPTTLIQRNRRRDPLDYIPEQELENVLLGTQESSWPGEVVIDTDSKAVSETFATVLETVRAFLGDT